MNLKTVNPPFDQKTKTFLKLTYSRSGDSLQLYQVLKAYKNGEVKK